jgi:hypothetical protein
MTTVYQPIVQIGLAHPGGASVTIRQGEACEVEGRSMVRTALGHLEPGVAGWHDTEAAAYQSAGDQVLDFARRAIERAEDFYRQGVAP